MPMAARVSLAALRGASAGSHLAGVLNHPLLDSTFRRSIVDSLLDLALLRGWFGSVFTLPALINDLMDSKTRIVPSIGN